MILKNINNIKNSLFTAKVSNKNRFNQNVWAISNIFDTYFLHKFYANILICYRLNR